MTEAKIKSLADAIASILLSHAAHGLATGSLIGTGEITLRDGLVVASAAEGARTRQAWVIEREVIPDDWEEAPVDLMISRVGHQNALRRLGGVELKWWRKEDAANSANRRRDLVRDLLRAGSLYQQISAFSFVALLSTAGSWSATAATSGSDKSVMSRLAVDGSQKWKLRDLTTSKAMVGAMKLLRGRVRIPTIFHTELVAARELRGDGETLAFAKIWKVKKPQKSAFFEEAELVDLLGGQELAPVDTP